MVLETPAIFFNQVLPEAFAIAGILFKVKRHAVWSKYLRDVMWRILRRSMMNILP
jgi:hypothetical protein